MPKPAPIPLSRHTESEFDVVAIEADAARPKPAPGMGGIIISTIGTVTPRLRKAAVPLIGINGQVAAHGWGTAMIQVPPGDHLVQLQRKGSVEVSRVVTVPANDCVELDYRKARGPHGGEYGHPDLGPAGNIRGTWSLLPYSLALVMVVLSLGTFILIPLQPEGISTERIMGLLSLDLIAAIVLVVAANLMVYRHQNRLRRAQAHQRPRQLPNSIASLIPDVPGLRHPASDDHTGVLLKLVGTIVNVDDVWLPAPVVSIDNEPVRLGFGLWWLPLPPGEHTVSVRSTPVSIDPKAEAAEKSLVVQVSSGIATSVWADLTVMASQTYRRDDSTGYTVWPSLKLKLR